MVPSRLVNWPRRRLGIVTVDLNDSLSFSLYIVPFIHKGFLFYVVTYPRTKKFSMSQELVGLQALDVAVDPNPSYPRISFLRKETLFWQHFIARNAFNINPLSITVPPL